MGMSTADWAEREGAEDLWTELEIHAKNASEGDFARMAMISLRQWHETRVPGSQSAAIAAAPYREALSRVVNGGPLCCHDIALFKQLLSKEPAAIAQAMSDRLRKLQLVLAAARAYEKDGCHPAGELKKAVAGVDALEAA